MAKKSQIETHNLTAKELHHLNICANDVFEFVKECNVIHPIKGKVPFLLFPFQIALLWAFLKHRFNIVLKFRQAGVTELISAFCLWYAMYHPHKNIVIISIKDRVAKKVLRKIKFMYKNLPYHLQMKVINGRGGDIGTASELEFSNGSMISSIPTTEEAGRSEAASLMVIDEAAIVRWADRIWSAAFPTLSTGGRAILNSTAYGVGNLFYKLYTNALTKGNPFNPIRLYWQMHPERDQKWYEEQRQILGPRKTAQEIDGDFLSSGNTVFDLADIRDIEDYADECPVLESHMAGLLKVYKRVRRDGKYFMGGDIATGRSQDYTSLSIMDEWGDEAVSFKGKIDIKKAEKMFGRWGRTYNKAIAAPESNDIGLGVAMGLQDNGYPRLYYTKSLLRKKGHSKPEQVEIPGWYTTKKNRPVMIAMLEEDIREVNIDVKDKAFCDEAKTFIYDSRGRPIAMNKDKESTDDVLSEDDAYTDDSIFGKAITNMVRKQGYNRASVNPR